jgi:hypothetical protein
MHCLEEQVVRVYLDSFVHVGTILYFTFLKIFGRLLPCVPSSAFPVGRLMAVYCISSPLVILSKLFNQAS